MLKTGIAGFGWLSVLLILWNSDPVCPRPVASTAPDVPEQYVLPNLPYDYAALEPAISRDIMQIHHQKHHQNYVKSLNKAVKEYAEAVKANDLSKQIELQGKIRFNGGGHINHSMFWTILRPVSSGGGQLRDGDLARALQNQFGGLDGLKKKVNEAALAIQGSGWVWLAFCLIKRELKISSTANQDPLGAPLIPIIGIDMWEHAYYLQYKNEKASYLTEIWTVIDFEEANNRFTAASARFVAED